MLVIRPAQMQVFEQRLLPDFENAMVLHLQESFPKHCVALGGEVVRARVRQGAIAARAHGFTQRGPVRLYLELLFIFGSGFVTDSQYPWAAAVLSGKEPPPSAAAARRRWR